MMNGECDPHSGSVNPKRTEYLPEEEPDWESFVLIQAWILEELNTTFWAARISVSEITLADLARASWASIIVQGAPFFQSPTHRHQLRGLWEGRWQFPEWPMESFCFLTLWLWALVLRHLLPNLNTSSRKQGLGEWAVYEPQEVNKLHTSRFSSENRISMHTNLNSHRNTLSINSRNHSFESIQQSI